MKDLSRALSEVLNRFRCNALHGLMAVGLTFGLSPLRAQVPEVINFYDAGQMVFANDGFIDANHHLFVPLVTEDNFRVARFAPDLSLVWARSLEVQVSQANSGDFFPLYDGTFFGSIRQDESGFAHFFRIDADGNLLVHHYFPVVSSVEQCLALPNGNILLLITYAGDSYVLCININGTLVWGLDLLAPGGYEVQAQHAITTADAAVLLVSGVYAAGMEEHVLLTKMDLAGNISWERYYRVDGAFDHFEDGIQASDGNFYLSGLRRPEDDNGYNAYDVLLRKFDGQGNQLTAKSYGYQYHDSGRDLVEDNEGNIILLALTKPLPSCGGNMALLKVDANLDTQIVRIYGEPMGQGAFYDHLHEWGDSIYSFGGGSNWSAAGNDAAHLLVLNNQLELPCSAHEQPMYVSAVDIYIELVPDISYLPVNPPMASQMTTAGDSLVAFQVCNATSTVSENTIHVLDIFPNPADELLSITSGTAVARVELWDLTGHQIVASETTTLNVSDVSAGIYLVVVLFSDGERAMEKVVIR